MAKVNTSERWTQGSVKRWIRGIVGMAVAAKDCTRFHDTASLPAKRNHFFFFFSARRFFSVCFCKSKINIFPDAKCCTTFPMLYTEWRGNTAHTTDQINNILMNYSNMHDSCALRAPNAFTSALLFGKKERKKRKAYKWKFNESRTTHSFSIAGPSCECVCHRTLNSSEFLIWPFCQPTRVRRREQSSD